MQQRVIYFLLCFLALGMLVQGLTTRVGHSQDDDTILDPSDTQTCLDCHETIDGAQFKASAHKRLNCQLCHSGVDRYPHPEQAIAKMPACTTCHAGKVGDLSNSVHGKAFAKKGQAPNCAACHGKNAHTMAPAARLTAKGPLCATCHQAQAGAMAKSVHKAVTGKSTPQCQTCHGDNTHRVGSPSKTAQLRVDEKCWSCHKDQAGMLADSAHGFSAGGKQGVTCFSCHGGSPHAVVRPHKTRASSPDAACRQCHQDIAKRLTGSAHGHAGAKTGKQIGCFDCHGDQPHQIHKTQHLSPTMKSALCESCHKDQVSRLVTSAHGTALVKKGQQLNCLSCHGNDQHAVIPPTQVTSLQKESSCRACHSKAVGELAKSAHRKTGAPNDTKKPSCTDCHPANPKLISADLKVVRAEAVKKCVSCHQQLSPQLKHDVHMRPDKVAGDHPTCLTCHGEHGHGVIKPATMTPKQKVQLCADCHSDSARMARYNVTTDTVPSYEETIHGKGIMRLGRTKEATCVDCHGLHGILPTHAAQAPTNPRNIATVCAKCHEGNRKDFAFSYASHFRLGVEKSVVNPLDRVFSLGMAFGGVIGLLSLVVLGYRQRLCNLGDVHTADRFLEGYNALSMIVFLIATTILLALLVMARVGEIAYQRHLWPAFGLLGLALVAQFLKRVLPPCRPITPPADEQ